MTENDNEQQDGGDESSKNFTCSSCGNAVAQGQNHCHKCGSSLNWGGV